MRAERLNAMEQYILGKETVSLEELSTQFSVSMNTIRRDVMELLSLLQSYVRNHFQYEENFMQKSDYPDYEKHKKIHASFGQKMTELQTKAMKSGKEEMLPLLREMSDYVRTWYVSHVLHEDKKMMAYYLECEAKKKMASKK